MRLAWVLLACVVLASGARSAPATSAACPPNFKNRVQAVFVPNGISHRAEAKLLAQAKARHSAQLELCLKAKRR